MRTRAMPALTTVTSLLLGSTAYLARPGEIRAARWAANLGIAWLPALFRRAPVPEITSTTARVVLGVLPDVAWSIAVASAVTAVWGDVESRGARVWLALGAAFVFAYELAQRPGIVPGTFDPLDLAASLVGYAFAVFVFSHSRGTLARHEIRNER